jgi:hypothetical protein
MMVPVFRLFRSFQLSFSGRQPLRCYMLFCIVHMYQLSASQRTLRVIITHYNPSRLPR